MRRSEREISEKVEIEEIIRTSDVCRIALSDNNIPYIVTMNFGYTNEPEQTIYFHCANKGRKLDMIRKNNYVCFEMDTNHRLYSGTSGCDWGMNYSSIVGYGTITVITDENEKKEGLNCLMEHYGGVQEYSYNEKILEKTTILKLKILEIAGKKK